MPSSRCDSLVLPLWERSIQKFLMKLLISFFPSNQIPHSVLFTPEHHKNHGFLDMHVQCMSQTLARAQKGKTQPSTISSIYTTQGVLEIHKVGNFMDSELYIIFYMKDKAWKSRVGIINL